MEGAYLINNFSAAAASFSHAFFIPIIHLLYCAFVALVLGRAPCWRLQHGRKAKVFILQVLVCFDFGWRRKAGGFTLFICSSPAGSSLFLWYQCMVRLTCNTTRCKKMTTEAKAVGAITHILTITFVCSFKVDHEAIPEFHSLCDQHLVELIMFTWFAEIWADKSSSLFISFKRRGGTPSSELLRASFLRPSNLKIILFASPTWRMSPKYDPRNVKFDLFPDSAPWLVVWCPMVAFKHGYCSSSGVLAMYCLVLELNFDLAFSSARGLLAYMAASAVLASSAPKFFLITSARCFTQMILFTSALKA